MVCPSGETVKPPSPSAGATTPPVAAPPAIGAVRSVEAPSQLVRAPASQ